MRTIVAIEERNGELTARLAKTNLALPDARKAVPLKFSADTLPPLDSPANIKAYGDSLRNALMQHPAIQAALTNISVTAPGSPQILCFEIDATEGERIRWEALCDAQGKFMGLDTRFHIGRIAEEASTSEASVRPFVPPLRLALFLSAAGADATPEWLGFAKAFDAEHAAGSPVEARVYVGQQELLDMIADEIAKGQHPGISVEPIPPSDVEVEQRLNDWSPHIVHFYCHGIVALGTGSLELATINEQALGKPGSVLINVDTLVNAEGLRDSWLVVLNCCQGGQAVEQLHSMAYSVVAKGGVPAAIGMLEPVTADDANAFCGSIYPEIFRTLRAASQLPPGAAPLLLNLSATIGAPRRTLYTRHAAVPANSSRWTLPVLYLHNQPLQVHRPAEVGLPVAAIDELRERAEMVADFLRALPPDTPPDVRLVMLATLDKPPAVPAAMRPNALGQFPTT